MAEFWGDAAAVERQKRLLARKPVFDRSPWLASGGRLLMIADPAPEFWPEVSAMVEEDGIVALVMMRPEVVGAWVARHLGDGWGVFSWDGFMGESAVVVPASEAVLRERRLPDGWSARTTLAPSDDEIAAMQALNAATGVSSSPAFAFRGDAFPALNVMIEDTSGRLMAMAHSAMIFHPESASSDVGFVGLVSVDEAARGLGLGVYANALVCAESQKAFGWRRVTEFVATDNPASRAMISRCGLNLDEGLVASIAIRGGGRFTR